MKTIPNDGLLRFRGLFNVNSLVITDPKGLAEVLVTRTYDFEKPVQLRNFLRRIIGDGLIIVEGDVHRFQRKHAMPAFSFRHIKDLYPIFNDKANALTQRLSQEVAGKLQPGQDSAVIEINHWANLVTMDIIGMAAMGRDFQSLRNTDDPLIKLYEELLEPTGEKQLLFVAMVFLPALTRLLPWKTAKRVDYITENLTNICIKLVRDKKEAMKTETANHKDILSLLIRSNNFSDQQLVDQLLTFLAAGHETTSSAFTWTTYLLTQNPKILAALREEVRGAGLPSRNSPTPANIDVASILETLPLLNGVCNETLRLFPTVPMTSRVANKDSQVLGEHIPKGTRLVLCMYAINRHPDLWGANADKFVPERWIDTDPSTGERRPNASGGAPTNYALLTFLHGPRSCIGQGFAKAELRCLVAAFVNAFDFEMADPNEEIIVHGVVTTKPKNGMNLRLKYIGDQS
jgi:cytochrome P450